MGNFSSSKIMKIIAIILFILLSSCATKKEFIRVDYKPTIPTLPQKPSLPILALTSKSEPDHVMKAYVASLVLQKSYIDEVNNMINSLY